MNINIIDINDLNVKKQVKRNKSYSLNEENIQAIENIATLKGLKDSRVLNEILTLTFKQNQQ